LRLSGVRAWFPLHFGGVRGLSPASCSGVSCPDGGGCDAALRAGEQVGDGETMGTMFSTTSTSSSLPSLWLLSACRISSGTWGTSGPSVGCVDLLVRVVDFLAACCRKVAAAF